MTIKHTPTKQEIGELVKAARYDIGVTQKDFAYMIGEDVQNIKNWETGRGRMSAAVLVKIVLLYLSEADLQSVEGFLNTVTRLHNKN